MSEQRRATRTRCIGLRGFGLLGLLLIACGAPQAPPQPASFDRPTDVDFACVVGNRVQRVEACAVPSPDRALHAVVTQSARGEIAAVNLATGRILDNRRDVPGYTFVPTGELPLAIIVSRRNPELTYVASFGSRDVRVMRTAVLVSLVNEAPEMQPPVRLSGVSDASAGAAAGSPTDMVLLPDESALIVSLGDTGRVARLPLLRCEDGADDCQPGLIDADGVTFIDLPIAAPEAGLPLVYDEPYALLCGGYERPTARAPEPREPAPAPSRAHPAALAVDTSCGSDCARVLVADEAQPLLHVLDLAALVEGSDPIRAPIPTGAPTRDVVVTPRVPVSIPMDAQDAGSTYYIYAIDAQDGSVLALEDDTVLAINRDPYGRADRLSLPSRTGTQAPLALALEVITPSFDPQGSPAQQVRPNETLESRTRSGDQFCFDARHPTLSPRRLRGVFLSVALADSTVRVVDVHDMELSVCRDCPTDSKPAALAVRHHQRLATDYAQTNVNERPVLRAQAGATAFVGAGATFTVRGDGSIVSPLAVGLECIACAAGLTQAFPDLEAVAAVSDDVTSPAEDAGAEPDAGDGEFAPQSLGCPASAPALICGVADPWAAPTVTYDLIYEGFLPGARGSDGLFLSPTAAENATGLPELRSAVPFCARGVLGLEDVDDARDESRCRQPPELRGDRVIFSSRLPTDAALAAMGRSEAERRRCAELRGQLETHDGALLSIEVVGAFEDRLALRNRLEPPLSSFDWADIRTCSGDGPLSFDVRTSDSFLVNVIDQGFRHTVVANAQGRCVVDALASPVATRAWTGCELRDERLQLRMRAFTPTAVVQEPGDGRGLTMRIASISSATPLIFDARQARLGSSALVPSRLRYSEESGELYLVDTHRGGLIPIPTDLFRDTPFSSFY